MNLNTRKTTLVLCMLESFGSNNVSQVSRPRTCEGAPDTSNQAGLGFRVFKKIPSTLLLREHYRFQLGLALGMHKLLPGSSLELNYRSLTRH